MKKRKALITGIAGQDGSYLAPLLLNAGYEVFGIAHHGTGIVSKDISDFNSIFIYEGSITDASFMKEVLYNVQPDEIYNLAALSSVSDSFKFPIETWNINYYAFGELVTQALALNPQVRIYQASTSEMFGNSPPPQNEDTPFNPQSPYAESKVKAYIDFIVRTRERTGAFLVAGILFNHESPRRKLQFVTRKITHSLAQISAGLLDYVELGNLNAVRDWGHAGDYAYAMYLMLQQEKPKDYVIASGVSHSIRDFVEVSAKYLDIQIVWEGEGVEEIGRNKLTGKVVVKVNPDFYRPQEVNFTEGDATKARTELGWVPKYSFEALVKEMVDTDRLLVTGEVM